MKNKKSLTKHDIIRAIKSMAMEIQMLQKHVMMIDNVVDMYIRMNKDEDKLKKYMEKLHKEKVEHKQSKRKQSRRDAKTSK
jgi:predicted RNA-binding protein with EMAP domain